MGNPNKQLDSCAGILISGIGDWV
ncbi:hypothetical protein Bhyg_10450 [Pseudolycoriella hygida]|uniref:Uncharacterized protein n=1 Tax=Pseudolycoriella hygida TaxID=35572 RepID=A0A9Q0MV83_9DIPT|nr:hypothetical protein Bhyg_10450 [Pseudolycoriella hygida]